MQQTSTREKPSCLVDLGSLCIGFGAKRHELSISFFGGRLRRRPSAPHVRHQHASESVRVRAKYGAAFLQRARGIVTFEQEVGAQWRAGSIAPGVAGCLSIEASRSAALLDRSSARTPSPSTCASRAAAPRRCTSTCLAPIVVLPSTSFSLRPRNFAISARAASRSPVRAAPSARVKLVIAAAQGKRSQGNSRAAGWNAAAAGQSRRSRT